MKNLLFSILPMIAILVSSCNSGKNWRETKLENTVNAFEEFLANNQETEHKDSVLLLIRQLEWLSAKNSNSMAALDSFSLKYPESKEYKDSIDDLKKDMVWMKVQAINTIETYQKYLEDYPVNQNRYKVEQKIRKLRWKAVKKINKKEAYIDFFADYTMAHFIDSVELIFELRDFVAYKVSFEYVEIQGNNEIDERLILSFNADRKLTGEYHGGSEGEYNVGWGGEIRGNFDEHSINNLEQRQTDFSDVSDFEPEPWRASDLIFNEKEMAFSNSEHIYKLVEIERIKK